MIVDMNDMSFKILEPEVPWSYATAENLYKIGAFLNSRYNRGE